MRHPRTRKTGHTTVRRSEAAGQGSPAPRALIVQDSARAAYRRLLTRLGFTVREENRGVTAMATARSWRPDLVLIDMQLRDAPGREVEGWLRSNPLLRDVHIVLIGNDCLTGTDSAGRTPTVCIHRSSPVSELARSISQVMDRQIPKGDKP